MILNKTYALINFKSIYERQRRMFVSSVQAAGEDEADEVVGVARVSDLFTIYVLARAFIVFVRECD